jgi:hypothetical protein
VSLLLQLLLLLKLALLSALLAHDMLPVLMLVLVLLLPCQLTLLPAQELKGEGTAEHRSSLDIRLPLLVNVLPSLMRMGRARELLLLAEDGS